MNTQINKPTIRVNTEFQDPNLHSYLNELAIIPRMDTEEEQRLVALKEDGDVDAAQKLILANLWFVVYQAKQFTGYKLPIGDLIQEGNVGLMKAIKKFNPKYGTRISTYAVHWIKSEMYNYVIKNFAMVNLATSKPQRKLFFRLKGMKSGTAAMSDQEIDDVAEKLNLKPSDVKEMDFRLTSCKDISLTAPYSNRNDSRLEFDAEKCLFNAPINHIPNDAGTNPLDYLEEESDNNNFHQALHSSIEYLTPREQDIIQSRWLDDVSPTLHDLADKYGVSAERIRQIETAALGKIKVRMTH